MKCVGYIRVNINEDINVNAVARQKAEFDKFIFEKGWDLYKYYVDTGSGIDDMRSNLRKLLLDMNEGKFDVILIKTISRLTRSTFQSLKIWETARSNNIHIVSLDGTLDTMFISDLEDESP